MNLESFFGESRLTLTRCVKYLTETLGVELDPNTLATWHDAEAADRLTREMKDLVGEGHFGKCDCGETRYFELWAGLRTEIRCQKCHDLIRRSRKLWVQTRDGARVDQRELHDQGRPYDNPFADPDHWMWS